MNTARMQSTVAWALLGLIIERPSYAYELALRFERIHGHTLELSSVSHIYTALATLRKWGYVQELPSASSAGKFRRQFGPTALGMNQHARWMLEEVVRERRRQRVLLRQFAPLAKIPERAHMVLDAYEEVCQGELARSNRIRPERIPGTTGFTARLISQETTLVVPGKLEWVGYAREQLEILSPTCGASPRVWLG